MSAILLETGSETGLFRECRYDARRHFLPCACRCWWAPARFSIAMNLGMNLGLHGFAHLEAIQTIRSGDFLATRKPWTGIGFNIETFAFF
jgi:hypothetical protein